MLVYIVIVNALFVDSAFLRWMCNDKNLQKGLWLFRASPYASVCVGRYLESELSDILRHPQPRLPGGRLKSRKYKKSAVGGKKSPATPVQKVITLFSIGSRHINGIHKLLFFYRRRPLFEPWRLLSSCSAWRWRWRWRQGGKLVFRLASLSTPIRRSRQQSPWLFVFISPPYSSIY